MLRRDHLDVIEPAVLAATDGNGYVSNDGRLHRVNGEYRIDQKKGQIRLYRIEGDAEELISTCSVNVNAIAKMLRKAKVNCGVAA